MLRLSREVDNVICNGLTDLLHIARTCKKLGTQIAYVVPGGPAHLSQRLGKGDVILAVDGLKVDSSNVADHLQGSDAIGSKVLLTVRQNVSGEYVNVELVRVPMLKFENIVRVLQTLALLKQNAHINEEYERKSNPEGQALTCVLLDKLLDLITKLQHENYDTEISMKRNFTSVSEDLRSQLAIAYEEIHRLRARVDDSNGEVTELYRLLAAEHKELEQKMLVKDQLAAEQILCRDDALQQQIKEAKVLGQVIAAAELQVKKLWI